MSAASVAVVVTSGERHEGKAGNSLRPASTSYTFIIHTFFHPIILILSSRMSIPS